MTAPPLRVGIIGATPGRGWGTAAHLPALAALPEFTVTAVATTRADTARATADAFGVPFAFHDSASLIASPEVDVVAVTVKVTQHDELVRAALSAGKHVFCEWPLGSNLAQAARLAELASATGSQHVVGLQGYHSPGARYVAELISDGSIGRLQAVSAVAVGRQGAGRIPAATAYAANRAAGASVLSITTAHLLATLGQATGLPRTLVSVVSAMHDTATVIETGEQIAVTAPDQVAVAGELDGGAALSVAVQGGAATGVHFEVRIVGTDATLLVRPDPSGASIHVADWHISVLRGSDPASELPVPDRFCPLPASIPAGMPRNVALVYRELAQAIAENRPAEPSFATAVRYHQLVDAIERAADSGRRQDVTSR
ncbi:MAG: Gfo/Idh/MocA family oxidoreductase [Actinobacteria bacterium]|nr:Gfo/Idh/MocA family oxidoreductase [Actinomycetota bacterium]